MQAALRRLETAQSHLDDFEEGEEAEYYFGDDDSDSDSGRDGDQDDGGGGAALRAS